MDQRLVNRASQGDLPNEALTDDRTSVSDAFTGNSLSRNRTKIHRD
jgi:hypothetical protein